MPDSPDCLTKRNGRAIQFRDWDAEDGSGAVAVTYQDHSSLDSLADEIREALALNYPLEGIVASFIESTLGPVKRMAKIEGARWAVNLLYGKPNKSLAVHCLASALGIADAHGQTQSDIARAHIRHKQDVLSLVKEFRAAFGIPLKLSGMRPKDGCARMRKRNHRHIKLPIPA